MLLAARPPKTQALGALKQVIGRSRKRTRPARITGWHCAGLTRRETDKKKRFEKQLKRALRARRAGGTQCTRCSGRTVPQRSSGTRPAQGLQFWAWLAHCGGATRSPAPSTAAYRDDGKSHEASTSSLEPESPEYLKPAPPGAFCC